MFKKPLNLLSSSKQNQALHNSQLSLNFFNTLSKQKEPFAPLKDGEAKVYSCGPTVYNKQHIGNMRSFVFADTLHRALKSAGFSVKHVINITDVGHLTDDADEGEDKIEKAAKEQQKSAQEIAHEITQLFLSDLKTLNLNLDEYIFPKATEFIDEQIKMVQSLEGRGYTYKTKDGIYFDTSKFASYGALGGVDLSGIKEGARIGKKTDKKNPSDFALWKFSPKNEKRQQEWNSPWGVGFPGWHIECSAMINAILGPQIDIHTGGIEHIAVHHNNEIAQSECATGKSPFVKYWLHAQHLKIDGEKMSKSLGNVLYLSDLLNKGFSAMDFRYFLLGAHYRSEINFTFEALEGAKHAWRKMQDFVLSYGSFIDTNAVDKAEFSKRHFNEFLSKLFDDLNTPQALATLWTTMKDKSLSKTMRANTVAKGLSVLGLKLEQQTKDVLEIPENVLSLAKQRSTARQNKNWELADKLRDEIQKQGFEVIDKKDGSELKPLN